MKRWFAHEITDLYQQWKKIPEEYVTVEDHQAEISTLRNALERMQAELDAVSQLAQSASDEWKTTGAELDRVMGEAVNFACAVPPCVCSYKGDNPDPCAYYEALKFLGSDTVAEWRKRREASTKGEPQ